MTSSSLLISILLIVAMNYLSVHGFATHSSSSRISRNMETELSLLPTAADFTETSSILLAKYDLSNTALATKVGSRALRTSDVAAQVLNDGSHALMDFPSLFLKSNNHTKYSRLRMRYAQVMGRLMIIGIGLLPNHGFHPEEMAIQLFLLGVSMKPIIRSIKLYQCLCSAECVDECEIDLENLEESLK